MVVRLRHLILMDQAEFLLLVQSHQPEVVWVGCMDIIPAVMAGRAAVAIGLTHRAAQEMLGVIPPLKVMRVDQVLSPQTFIQRVVVVAHPQLE